MHYHLFYFPAYILFGLTEPLLFILISYIFIHNFFRFKLILYGKNQPPRAFIH